MVKRGSFGGVIVLINFMIIRIMVVQILCCGKRVESSMLEAMYVLGDSSVDCGDNTLFYPLLRRNLSLHPCDGSYTTLLPHLLAKKIGLPYATPFYSQAGSTEVLLRGINFGSAGATIIIYPTTTLRHQSLNQQIRQLFEIMQLLQLRLGQDHSDHFINSSALFYLSFGKDDYIDLFLGNSRSHRIQQQLSHVLVDQMNNAIRNLYDIGARKFVYAGILPLGCAPRVLWERSSSNVAGGSTGGCSAEINNLVLEYNNMLEQRIVGLNAELAGVQIVFCDVYRVMMNIITNPKAYGFEDVKSACCGLGEYGGMSGCLSMDMACSNASLHVWWDLYNPTHAVNTLTADSAWSGQPLRDICRPITIEKLVSS